MSTFNPPAPLNALTKARSVDINALTDSVSAAFALLPDDVDLINGTVNYGTDTGIANVYVVTLPTSPLTLTDGLTVQFSPLNSNSGNSSINVNGLGVVSVRLRDSSQARPGDIPAGVPLVARYSTFTGFFHIDGNANTAGTAVFVAPVSDLTPIVKNAADESKLLKFDLSMLTTGTTRTATFPDRDIYLGASLIRVQRSSNIPLVDSDTGQFIDVTAGGFTQTFDAGIVASWYIFYRNSSSLPVTIPSSDGLTNWKLYPNETRIFMFDGTNFYSDWISPFLYIPAASETFIWPPGYAQVETDLVGGGGGGGSGRRSATGAVIGGGAPGGAPGRAIAKHSQAPGTNIVVSIGAAGVGGASQTVNTTSGINGTSGGNTTFGTLSTAYGGVGGVGGSTSATSLSSGSGSLSAGASGSAAVAGGLPSAPYFGGIFSADTGSNMGEGGAAAVSTFNTGCSIYGGAASDFTAYTGTSVNDGGSSMLGVSGGTCGGGITAASAVAAKAGNAGTRKSYTPGGGAVGGNCGASPTVGENGTAAPTISDCGTSGAGGGSSVTVAAAAGGNGGFPGGAGGGGGASVNGQNSGPGGNGAAGRAIIKGVA